MHHRPNTVGVGVDQPRRIGTVEDLRRAVDGRRDDGTGLVVEAPAAGASISGDGTGPLVGDAAPVQRDAVREGYYGAGAVADGAEDGREGIDAGEAVGNAIASFRQRLTGRV